MDQVGMQHWGHWAPVPRPLKNKKNIELLVSHDGLVSRILGWCPGVRPGTPPRTIFTKCLDARL